MHSFSGLFVNASSDIVVPGEAFRRRTTLRGLGASTVSRTTVAAMLVRLQVLEARFGAQFAMGDIPELFLSRQDRLDFEDARDQLLLELGFTTGSTRVGGGTARQQGLVPVLLTGTVGAARADTDRLLAVHADKVLPPPTPPAPDQPKADTGLSGGAIAALVGLGMAGVWFAARKRA